MNYLIIPPMTERKPQYMAPIRKVEEKHNKLRIATAEYLQGEIGLEEYKHITDQIPGLDLRAIIAWQMRRNTQVKIDSAKENLRELVNGIKARFG
jgi:hypothetical protein